MAIAIGTCVVWARFNMTEREARRVVANAAVSQHIPGVRVFPCDSHEKAVELAKVLG